MGCRRGAIEVILMTTVYTQALIMIIGCLLIGHSLIINEYVIAVIVGIMMIFILEYNRRKMEVERIKSIGKKEEEKE